MVNDELEVKLTKKDYKRLYGKERYLITKSGYVFDRHVFRWYSLFIVVVAFIVFLQIGGFGSKYAYASCGDDFIGNNLPCDNYLYGKCDLPACQKAILQPGETIGEKPPERKNDFYGIILMSLVGAFLLNHIFNNLTDENKKQARRYNARNRIKSKK